MKKRDKRKRTRLKNAKRRIVQIDPPRITPRAYPLDADCLSCGTPTTARIDGLCHACYEGRGTTPPPVKLMPGDDIPF